MQKKACLPYYHPSTVMLVDDNARFLDSFVLSLPAELASRSFYNPASALDWINHHPHRPTLDQRCLSLLSSSPASNTIRLDMALIEEEISDPTRFSDISVLVVDYDMPEMDGLALCAGIDNPRIRKILLTSIGDEKVAVNAFNEGLIDRYIKKTDPDVSNKVSSAISELQRRYFRDLSRWIHTALTLKYPDFLSDPAFVAAFEALSAQHDIVEYYFVDEPSGFLMVSRNGALFRLLVTTEQQLEQSLFAVKRWQPPAWVLDHLRQHKQLLWLWETPDDNDSEPFHWQDYLHPATPVAGQQRWYLALVEEPPADIGYDSTLSSYRAYLTVLDESPPAPPEPSFHR